MTPNIVTDERMPPGVVALVSGDSVAAVVNGEVHTFRISSLGRHDCPFAGCQLSLGHPLPHCCTDPDGADQYLICDDDGRILRSV